jgi:Mn-dependent DtxR family transcriptional regulator
MQKVKELLRRHRILPPPDLNEAVLRCVYEWSLVDMGSHAIASSAQIAAAMEIPEDLVLDALQQLADDEYIDVRLLRAAGQTMDAMVRTMLPAGLRKVGAWLD